MATYRILFFGADKHISRANFVTCPSDLEAMAVAATIDSSDAEVEVWQNVRMVGCIKDDQFSGCSR